VAADIRSFLNRALAQLHRERSRIDRQIAALSEAFGTMGRGSGPRAGTAKRKKSGKKRTLSASQKAAVSKRMKAYWAKRRAEKKS